MLKEYEATRYIAPEGLHSPTTSVGPWTGASSVDGRRDEGENSGDQY